VAPLQTLFGVVTALPKLLDPLAGFGEGAAVHGVVSRLIVEDRRADSVGGVLGEEAASPFHAS